MDNLDAILAQASAEVERAKRERKPAIAGNGLVESDYKSAAFIALYNVCACTRCGAKQMTFEGLFEERAHRLRHTDLHLVRLPTLPIESSTLPRKRRFSTHNVPYCGECIHPETYKVESDA